MVPKFDYSLRKQMVNPKKVYGIDTGLVRVTSTSFTEDNGRLLENLIFLHLRRQYKEIFYFSEKGECDFVAFDKGNIQEIIQVCFDLNADNLSRELNGVIEALKFFNKTEGTIITLRQKDRFEKDGCLIEVIPCHEFLQ